MKVWFTDKMAEKLNLSEGQVFIGFFNGFTQHRETSIEANTKNITGGY